MIKLDRQDHQALVNLLAAMPEMRSQQEREKSLKNANLKEFVLKIDLAGDVIVAINTLINYLLNYGRLENGKFPLAIFLSSLKKQKNIGTEGNKLIDRLLDIYNRDYLQFNARTKIQQLILQQINREVIERLKQLLKDRSYIVLNKFEDPRQVNSLRSMDITIFNLPPRRLAPQINIIQIYDRIDINGRLLILGSPGSGKTTILLQLTKILVERAYSNYLHPIPILLNLSSWKNNRQNINNWIVDELKIKYGVGKDIGKKWLEYRTIVLLLDGLDEVETNRQKLCVQKINHFLVSYNRTAKIIICSRSEEYQKTGELLKLNGSIILESLQEEQIKAYLLKLSKKSVWNSLKKDPNLLRLVQTPFILNIWLCSYKKISRSQWQELQNDRQQISYLFDLYIKQLLDPSLDNDKNDRNFKIPFFRQQLHPKQKDTIHWLSWLAVQLINTNRTELLRENIQSYWLSFKKKKFIYGLLIGIVIGLIIRLAIGLIIRIIIGLIIGLIVGLVYGLTGGLRFYTWESININPKKLLVVVIKKLIDGGTFGGLIVGAIAGLIVGLIVGLLGAGAVQGLIIGLVAGLIEELIEDVKIKKINIKKYLTQKVKNRFKKIVKNSSIVSLFSIALLLFLTKIFPQSLNYINSIQVDRLIDLFSTIAITGFIWLTAFLPIEKFIIRMVLYLDGYAPWYYISFMEYCCDRLLIQRVAGGYRFADRLLQEHLAGIWYEQEKA